MDQELFQTLARHSHSQLLSFIVEPSSRHRPRTTACVRPKHRHQQPFRPVPRGICDRRPKIEMTNNNAKEVGRMVRCDLPGKGRHWFPEIVLVSALLLCGCASVQRKSAAPDFGSGVAEYKQLTEGALTAITAALTSLNGVTSQPAPCPPDLIAAFSHQVQQLQIDSLRIRARGQAILA